MADRVKFKCGCGQMFAATTSMAGKRVKCPGCAKVVQIPRSAPPKPIDEELEVLPLVEGFNWQDQPSPLAAPKSAASQPAVAASPHRPAVAASARGNPAAPARPSAAAARPAPSGGFAPPPLPTAAPNVANLPAKSNSIWDEVEEDDIRVQAAVKPLCPNCGTAMSPQAVVCLSCGCNRQTGVVPSVQVSRPKAKQRVDPFRWLRRERGSRDGGSIVGLRLTLGLLVAGVVMAGMGFKEMTLANASSDVPETISLKQLIERGADGNPNLILTDFRLCRNYVCEVKEGVDDSWTRFWVPIIPYEGAAGKMPEAVAAQNPQAIIYSNNIRNEHDALTKLQGRTLRGMVTNRIESIESEGKKKLRENYPAVNFDRCLIFHEGREPKSSSTIMFLLTAGIVAAAAGGLLLLKRIL